MSGRHRGGRPPSPEDGPSEPGGEGSPADVLVDGVPYGPAAVVPRVDRASTPTVLPDSDAGNGRRELARTSRRRRRRRQRWVAAGVVGALLMAGAVVGVRHARHPHAAAVASGRTQRTLLLGIGNNGGTAQSVALLAADPASGAGATLLIPPDTLVDGPGNTVGASFALGPSAEFAGSVSDLLGVRIDYTWRLAPRGLAELVDRLGGVTVNVDEQIATPGLALNAGDQKLGGAQAAAYAVYIGDGTEQSRANRTRLVLDGLMAALPKVPLAVANLIGSLGPNSSLSVPASTVGTFLVSLAASSDADNEQDIPVTALDAGGNQPAFSLDQAAATTLIGSLLGPSLLANAGAQGTRVEIVNDSGRPELATGARAKLAAHGLTFVRAVNDVPFHQYRKSVILVFDSSAAAVAFGHRVAAALGVPTAAVEVSQEGATVADAIAILADDYRP